MDDSLAQRIGWVLWPAFLVACVAELVFFSLVDPSDLHLLGMPLELDRMPIYTLGFFGFGVRGVLESVQRVERFDRLAGAVAVRGQPPHAHRHRTPRSARVSSMSRPFGLSVDAAVTVRRITDCGSVIADQ